MDSLKNWKRALLRDEQGDIWRDINGKVQQECHKRRTPIHQILTNETPYRSIFLAPLAPKLAVDLGLRARSSSASSNSIETDSSIAETEETQTTTPTETMGDEQNRSSQVLLAIRISEDYLTTDNREQRIHEWREWIRNVPPAARGIKIQGVYESFSTLILLSVPTAVWTLLPKNPAYSFIGFITSDNMLSSFNSPQPHQSSFTIPELSRAVGAQVGDHNSQNSMPITVDQQRAVAWLMQQFERLEIKSLRPERDRDDISQVSTLIELSKHKDRMWVLNNLALVW